MKRFYTCKDVMDAMGVGESKALNFSTFICLLF